MIYDFACDGCRVITELERPVSMAGLPEMCSWCGEEMRRIFYAPRLLGRSKPGSFRQDAGKLNAWDDRLAHLREVEGKWGSAGLRKVRKEVGETLYNKTLSHKKDRYTV
jgi:hypothetical protein